MENTVKIEPALTPEQWEFTKKHPERWVLQEPRHAAAALSLYGQPFGFTREDVKTLRAISASSKESGPTIAAIKKHLGEPPAPPAPDGPWWIDNLADRIESLLPPE